MPVILGKIAWSLLTPGSLLFTLLLLALVLSWWSATRRWGIRLGLPVLALVIGMGFAPTFDWLIRPLEDYYPIPPLPAKVDGIIVLGGSEDPGLTAAHGGQPQVGASAERLIVFADLARRYPAARLIFTGRGVWSGGEAISEADVARGALAMMGLDTGRVQFENESRNTIENAEKSLPLAQPKPGETWLLVTSAIHMPRAVNCFRAVGWPVLPYPVDFIAGEPVAHLPFLPLSALNRLNAAALEWAGLVAYRVLGRTHELLPPRTLATMKQE